ncbi:hypothetical protein CYMTET_35107, partial [Cymbomonas tetramitiformis]
GSRLRQGAHGDGLMTDRWARLRAGASQEASSLQGEKLKSAGDGLVDGMVPWREWKAMVEAREEAEATQELTERLDSAELEALNATLGEVVDMPVAGASVGEENGRSAPEELEHKRVLLQETDARVKARSDSEALVESRARVRRIIQGNDEEDKQEEPSAGGKSFKKGKAWSSALNTLRMCVLRPSQKHTREEAAVLLDLLRSLSNSHLDPSEPVSLTDVAAQLVSLARTVPDSVGDAVKCRVLACYVTAMDPAAAAQVLSTLSSLPSLRAAPTSIEQPVEGEGLALAARVLQSMDCSAAVQVVASAEARAAAMLLRVEGVQLAELEERVHAVTELREQAAAQLKTTTRASDPETLARELTGLIDPTLGGEMALQLAVKGRFRGILGAALAELEAKEWGAVLGLLGPRIVAKLLAEVHEQDASLDRAAALIQVLPSMTLLAQTLEQLQLMEPELATSILLELSNDEAAKHIAVLQMMTGDVAACLVESLESGAVAKMLRLLSAAAAAPFVRQMSPESLVPLIARFLDEDFAVRLLRCLPIAQISKVLDALEMRQVMRLLRALNLPDELAPEEELDPMAAALPARALSRILVKMECSASMGALSLMDSAEAATYLADMEPDSVYTILSAGNAKDVARITLLLDYTMALPVMSRMTPAMCKTVLDHVPPMQAVEYFEAMSAGHAVEVMNMLEPGHCMRIVERMRLPKSVRLLGDMDAAGLGALLELDGDSRLVQDVGAWPNGLPEGIWEVILPGIAPRSTARALMLMNAVKAGLRVESSLSESPNMVTAVQMVDSARMAAIVQTMVSRTGAAVLQSLTSEHAADTLVRMIRHFSAKVAGICEILPPRVVATVCCAMPEHSAVAILTQVDISTNARVVECLEPRPAARRLELMSSDRMLKARTQEAALLSPHLSGQYPPPPPFQLPSLRLWAAVPGSADSAVDGHFGRGMKAPPPWHRCERGSARGDHPSARVGLQAGGWLLHFQRRGQLFA